jgi:hypothetical protein
MAEGRPAIKARECQIDQKILRPLGRDLRPCVGARRALYQVKRPFEAAKGGDDSGSFREFVDIRETAACGKEIH